MERSGSQPLLSTSKPACKYLNPPNWYTVDKLTDEERKGILQKIVEEVVIDRNDYVKITLAIPVDYNSPEPGSPEPESVAFASKVPSL